MLSNPTSRRAYTAARTAAGVARRSSTVSRRSRKLCAPTETRVTPCSRRSWGQLRRHRLGIPLDRDLVGRGQRTQQPRELRSGGERRCATAEEDRLETGREQHAFQLELGEERVHVAPVIGGAADERDEVAVPAAVDAERQVNVQMTHPAAVGAAGGAGPVP